MTDINEKLEYAQWQKVTVPTGKGDKEFIVYSSGKDNDYHHVGDMEDRRLTTVSGPHLHGAYDYDLEEDALYFGCASCTEWNCSERGCYKNDVHGKPILYEPLYDESGKRVVEPITSFCIHIQAVITFLKKKEELENQNIEFEEYTGKWRTYFDITRKKRVSSEDRAAGSGYKANPADDSVSLPDHQNHD